MPLPGWAEWGLVPLVDVVLAFLVGALVVAAVGVNPATALSVLLDGALGSGGAIGYTLYYATNFVFTGLAVSVAFHCGLFNIGGEGQAMLGGLGAALVAIACDTILPAWLLLPAAVAAAALFGAAWAIVPGWLQAHRGSHIVITTIMFNFLAATLMVYLLVHVLIEPGSMAPESRAFGPAATLPSMQAMARGLGLDVPPSPLNLSAVLATLAAPAVWFLIWKTRAGYAIRVLGANPDAARYAGIDAKRLTIGVMALSGALAGLVGINEILGVHHRLLLNFTSGYGFAGIAVALMGRNHPLGIVLASLLFGVLYQGGAEMTFEIPTLSRDMVSVIQGLVILFSGALAGISRRPIARLFGLVASTRTAEPAQARG